MPSETAKTELLSALQNSRNRLEYLNSEDWALLVDKAEVLAFAKDEVIIQAGVRPRQLFFIVRGKALIESARGLKFAEVSEGDICGEMSFLEDTIAAARVVAEENVETVAIEWTTLHQLFQQHPHIGSRFFHSLALNLSRRLRRQLRT
jgi:CRP-like cAMP-binding protein